ncbi:MAG TPA: pyridoxamine 5'-phosphate oxidase family protein [Thermomicrobiales bacterium]|nr:pyridoxamine 5'-phosphate oxidase family protein [Thermomicrobiales bacterium]
MTDHTPVDTTFLGLADQPAMEWSRPRELLAAPPPPDTPGGHFSSYLVTVRPDGRPHATRVGVRWHDGDLYFLSGPGTRKSRNLAANRASTLAMRLEEGLDLVLEGEAAPVDDPALLDAVGSVIRQAGWPVELTGGGFTAPFGPQESGPPWQLYRFVFHTAIGQAGDGATRWRFVR